MTRFTKGILIAASIFVLVNVTTYLVPLGVEGFPYRRMGFPRPFWHDYGDHSSFRWDSLLLDIVIASMLSYGFARWYERKDSIF
jgi:hypothetical protein